MEYVIKIYTDRTYLTPQYRRIIFPLLLDLCYINNLNLLKIYRLVNTIAEADVVIIPVQIAYFFDNKKEQWLYDFIEEANALKKKVWVYTAGDFGMTLSAPVYTFRLGGFNSKLDARTFIVPAFITDPYKLLQTNFKPLSKRSSAIVGFVGNANGSLIKWCKEFFIYLYHNSKRMSNKVSDDYQPFYPSSIKRHKYLQAMQINSKIETNFIFRKKYRAGVKTEAQKKQTTLEFFENIANNPYVFCLRGAGNFSIRLYETLAMGRIPIIIDTDIRLPLPDIILWKNHSVMATENNFIETLIDFHENITAEDFEKMQINNRNLWLNYLNRESFFSTIHSTFKNLQ